MTHIFRIVTELTVKFMSREATIEPAVVSQPFACGEASIYATQSTQANKVNTEVVC